MAPPGRRGADASPSSTRRYSAAVTKNESVWKQEWAGFMSGVSLKTLRDGSSGVVIRSSRDIMQEQDDESGGGSTYSYLFNSPAERKAARKAEQAKRAMKSSKDEEGQSKHQLAILEAQQRGLQLEGMTRKERRHFLQLSSDAKAKEAEAEDAPPSRPHELMDEKLAWYQQGPFPIDVIAEKLVRRKAEKKGKRLGLKYNYLMPHPSWIARRARKRLENVITAQGRRVELDDDGHEVAPAADAVNAGQIHQSSLLHSLLVDPSTASTSTVKTIVKNREAAQMLKTANLSTAFLSSSIVKSKRSIEE